jgi:hypothetical protein
MASPTPTEMPTRSTCEQQPRFIPDDGPRHLSSKPYIPQSVGDGILQRASPGRAAKGSFIRRPGMKGLWQAHERTRAFPAQLPGSERWQQALRSRHSPSFSGPSTKI